MVLVAKFKEPVADWLPIVLPLETNTPSCRIIAAKGLLVLVPLDVTPVMLTDAMVLFETVVVVPDEEPLKNIPTNLAPEPLPVNE